MKVSASSQSLAEVQVKLSFQCHGIKDVIVGCICVYFNSLAEVCTIHILYMDVAGSEFVSVQYKQDLVVAMQLYVGIFGSLLSATLKEKVRNTASKNSGSADRGALGSFEHGFSLKTYFM